METLTIEQDGLFSEQNLVVLGNKLLPLLGKYEGWPSGKLEHMFASGEALQVTLVFAKLLQMGLTEEDLIHKIAEGEITQIMQQAAKHNQTLSDPQDWLFDAINKGRRQLDQFLHNLEPYLTDNVRGFAVDVAAGSTFLVQNFIRRWPGLKVYPADRAKDSQVEGAKFMQWCLQQFAESPPRNFMELAARQAAIKAGTGKPVTQVNLLDSLWYPSKPPYPDAQRDAIFSSHLLDRASNVDITSDGWEEVSHLHGACKLVICVTSLQWPELDNSRDETLARIIANAAKLLRIGCVMLLADTSREEASLCEQTIQACGLAVLVSSHTDEKDPKPFCILKKVSADENEVSAEDRLRVARGHIVQLREQGNKCFNAKTDRDYDKAISLYTKALDLHSVGWLTDAGIASRLESNLSAALMERGRYLESLDAADNAARWDPTWSKAQYRRMKALYALDRKGEALAASVSCDALKADEERGKSSLGIPPPAGIGLEKEFSEEPPKQLNIFSRLMTFQSSLCGECFPKFLLQK